MCTPSPDKDQTVGTIHRFYDYSRKCACGKIDLQVASWLPEMAQQRTTKRNGTYDSGN